MPPRGQHSFDLASQRAVEVAVHHRGFGERTLLPFGEELGAADEIIITSGHFARPGRPGRTRHRVAEILTPTQERLRDRRLPAPARRAQDDRKRAHSRFSTCSRIRSSSSFTWSTSATIALSLPLLPVVFASRSIS